MKFKFRLNESLSTSKDIPLYYDDIEVVTKSGFDRESGPWCETEYVVWEYEISEQQAAECIADYLSDDLSDEEWLAIVGEDEDQDKLYQYIEENFDKLFEKYKDDITDYYKDSAESDAAEKWEPEEPDYDDWDD